MLHTQPFSITKQQQLEVQCVVLVAAKDFRIFV
jgi:hypothetical protein